MTPDEARAKLDEIASSGIRLTDGDGCARQAVLDLIMYLKSTLSEPIRPHWPPQVGSVWSDRDEDVWICRAHGELTLGRHRGLPMPADEVWSQYGPLTFVRTFVEEEPF